MKNIYKSFGDNKVLNDITLNVKQGELVSLLGPSGCGKTTLLKVIAGLESADEGSVFIDSVCCDNIPARKRGAVIVFQDYGLFPHMTVAENIGFGLSAQKMKKAEQDMKIAKMLEIMQITEKADQYPYALSGGQKQRVALGRACVLEPKLLLLDEPFSNLDSGLKGAMGEFVLKLQKDLGITTILVTHDKEEAFMLSQKVAVIFNGWVQQLGTPMEIYTQPLTKEVADFIGEANYIPGEVKDGVFNCSFGEYATKGIPSGRTELMVRYDQFDINEKDGVSCEIIDKRYKGSGTIYAVKVIGGCIGELYVNSLNSRYNLGDKVFVKVKEGAGLVLGDFR
jgi:iron(III) transport system ATP-binding protein